MILPNNSRKLTAEDRQANTTNSKLRGQIIQSGWGYLTWSGSATTSSETVTMPVAFTTNYVVVATCTGYRFGANPTSESDSDGVQDISMYCDITGLQTFTIEAKKLDGVNVNSSVRTIYSWIAIGK